LAEHGVSVRLFESHELPSDTLSTHFFRGDGLVRSLQEVGVLDEVLATDAPPLVCEYFSADGRPFVLRPPQEPGSIGYCLSVCRSVLDGILARRAVAAGVDVRYRTRIVDVLRNDGAVTGVIDHNGTHLEARVVVGADGRRSTVARLVAAGDEERHPPARAMYYRYATGWRFPDPIGAEFLLHGHRFCYAFPSDAGVTCLAVSLPLDDHERSGRDRAEALETTFRSNPQTADRMDGIEWVSGVFVGLPADSVWRIPCGPGWALVGDASSSQDPWAGLGMDTAARQAEAFVETYRAGDWAASYPTLRRTRTYAGFEQTTLLAPDLRKLLQPNVDSG
jgi:2-polyprenyl-6-methoxyphenol hydroxylase-like FAD-dependent oxidoreductase